MQPRIFIGSSTEGLAIAEVVFNDLKRVATPTLWTNEHFLPGRHPMDVLEEQLRANSFAVLVASPDDEIVKRGVRSHVMRDNLLIEFGLFVGALGRRRSFFLCPDEPRLDLPTDLAGITVADYDGSRAAGPLAERAAAVQSACLRIREVICDEWVSIQRSEEAALRKLQASREMQAVRRLHGAVSRLRETMTALQRDALAAAVSPDAFEDMRTRAADELSSVYDSFKADAGLVGAESELLQLSMAVRDAILDVPFPEELATVFNVATREGVDLGLRAFDGLLRGRNPIRDLQDNAMDRAATVLESVSRRYAEWWGRHQPGLHAASANMQDVLIKILLKMGSHTGQI